MDKHICKAKVMSDIWNIKHGDWVYGYYVALPDEYTHGKDVCYAIFSLDCRHIYMGEYQSYGWYKVDPNTVCRCTGREDKNGNMIFEHDIVIGKANVPMTVVWNDVWACYEVEYEMDGVGLCSNTLCASEKLEIIGNEFDNTELMEG